MYHITRAYGFFYRSQTKKKAKNKSYALNSDFGAYKWKSYQIELGKVSKKERKPNQKWTFSE